VVGWNLPFRIRQQRMQPLLVRKNLDCPPNQVDDKGTPVVVTPYCRSSAFGAVRQGVGVPQMFALCISTEGEAVRSI
jgi:hypothetical protein